MAGWLCVSRPSGPAARARRGVRCPGETMSKAIAGSLERFRWDDSRFCLIAAARPPMSMAKMTRNRAAEAGRSGQATRAVPKRDHGTWRLLFSVFRKPAVVGRWLGSARSAQIAVLLLSLGLFWAWPPALEATLNQLHPPEHRQTRVLGFIRVPRHDVLRKVETQELWATRTVWGLSGAVVLWLLWAHLRPAAVEAEALSRRREREADGLSPGAKKRLQRYRSALRLALDRQRETLLLHKLEKEAEAVPHMAISGNGGNRYRVHEEIGRGGLGVVYRGSEPRLGRDVALKRLAPVLSTDLDLADSLRREARVLARLSHPNIVQVFDIVEDQSAIWIVLELVEGTDVAARIREAGSLNPAEVAAIGTEVAAALSYAHSRDLLHRDVKPANLLLDSQGQLKLADFGIAKVVAPDGGRTHTGSIIGSPRYMSPEQRQGAPLDQRTDIYSLGVSLYEMLTGNAPNPKDPEMLDDGSDSGAFPRPSDSVDLPAELDQLVMEMLAVSPQDRPASMNEVLNGLSKLNSASAVEG